MKKAEKERIASTCTDSSPLSFARTNNSGYDTLLLPYRIMTHSDGRIFERRRGARETADDEDLTDDEEGGGGWME